MLPVLKKYCADCHGAQTQEADVNLAQDRSIEQLTSDARLWFRVLDQLAAGTMPPKEEAQPSSDERKAIMQWINGPLTNTLVEQRRSKGRAKFRRLTRREYLNTFVDLFGPTQNLYEKSSEPLTIN